MRRFAVAALGALTIAACSEVTEPQQNDPTGTTPQFAKPDNPGGGGGGGNEESGYTITQLGALPGGEQSSARDINDDGVIVGFGFDAAGVLRAVRWVNGEIEELSIAGDSRADAINNVGQIAGTSGDTHAFRWDDGELLDLGDLGGSYSRAWGINDLGHVVGESVTPSGATHAFLWTEADGMQDLGTLAGADGSHAFGINGAGQIVGSTGGALVHGFLWTAAGGLQDLGTLGGRYSWARSINDAGQLAGWSSNASGHARAIVWQDVVFTDLGTLGGGWSQAHGINDRGQVVGISATGKGHARHAFVWTAEGGMIDLGKPKRTDFSIAYAVNEAGQIVGASVEETSYFQRALLWTPKSSN